MKWVDNEEVLEKIEKGKITLRKNFRQELR